MADPEPRQLLKEGVEAWPAWRDRYRDLRPALSSANLYEAGEPMPTVSGFPDPECWVAVAAFHGSCETLQTARRETHCWGIRHKPRQNIVYLSAELNRLNWIRVSTYISIRDS